MIEAEELNGQKLQGTGTAKDVMTCINQLGKKAEFPLFTIIHAIAFEGRTTQEPHRSQCMTAPTRRHGTCFRADTRPFKVLRDCGTDLSGCCVGPRSTF